MDDIEEMDFGDFNEDDLKFFEAEQGSAEVQDEVKKEKGGDDNDDDDDVLVEKRKKKSKKDKKEKKGKKRVAFNEPDDDDDNEAKRMKLLQDHDIDVTDDVTVKSEINEAPSSQAKPPSENYINQTTSNQKAQIKELQAEKDQHQSQVTHLTLALKQLGKVKRQELDSEGYRQWKQNWVKEHKLGELRAKITNLEQRIAEAKRQEIEGDEHREELNEKLGGDKFTKLLKKLAPVRNSAQTYDTEKATEKAEDLLLKMDQARIDDLNMMKRRLPATHKLQILKEVENICRRAGLQEALVKAGLLKSIESWLRAPPGQLASYQIRSALLKILFDLPYEGDPGRVRAAYETQWKGVSREQIIQTSLGKQVKMLAAHESETQENRKLATKLMEKWSRIIFGLSKNYKELATLEKETGRRSNFKPDVYVIPADVVKYTRDGQKFVADRNADGEAAAQRCRLPKTMMPDFTARPAFVPVEAKLKSEAHRVMERNLRAARKQTQRSVTLSIEGSASTLKAEDC